MMKTANQLILFQKLEKNLFIVLLLQLSTEIVNLSTKYRNLSRIYNTSAKLIFYKNGNLYYLKILLKYFVSS